MMSDSDALTFDKHGYIHVRDVIDATTVAELRTVFLEALAKQGTRLLVDSAIQFPRMRELLRRPKLMNTLTAILGKPFLVLPPTSVDHNRFGQFHTDTSGAEMTGWTFHKDPDFRAVVLGLYLQDNNDYGGGLRVVPGTHREPDVFVSMLKKKHEVRAAVDRSWVRSFLKRVSRGRLFTWRDDALENVPNQIDVPTKAGDALMWDMRLVHRASPQKIEGEAIPGGKVALFYVLGTDNAATRKWLEYLTVSGEMEKVRAKGTVVPAPNEDFIVL